VDPREAARAREILEERAPFGIDVRIDVMHHLARETRHADGSVVGGRPDPGGVARLPEADVVAAAGTAAVEALEREVSELNRNGVRVRFVGDLARLSRGVRERTTSIDLNGQTCRVLSREDLLLHLCVHYCFHLIMGVPSLVQLIDLLIVTQVDNINWTAFEQRAISQRAAPYALAALTQAEKLLGARVPGETFARLTDATPKTMRHRVTQLDLSDILRRTQQKPLTSIRQRLMRGLRDRAETARWATDWHARLQVWKSALLFTRTDTAQMLMKNVE